MEKENKAVDKIILVALVFVGLILAIHVLLVRMYQGLMRLDYYNASCLSGITILVFFYAAIKFSKPLEHQIVNFVYFKDKRHYKTLLDESIRDGLTGLFGHKYFMQKLEEEVERSKKSLSPLSLLMIDIDYFKKFNDTFGHLEGDMILTELAAMFKRFRREQVDLAARYGGEEFVILLPETSKENAKILAEELLNHAKKINTSKGVVTISIGIGCFDGNSKDFAKEDLIRISDAALYRAKAAGRDRVEIQRESEKDVCEE
ncbi:MAG: GGDEF domain-containing protein [Candidatus Omnitrophica bacterium]|nr:GGDEF domain-containing protein [Candidatus Omnitrophota bacterium]